MLGIIEQKLVVATRSTSLVLLDSDDCLAWSNDSRIAFVTPASIFVYDVDSSCTDAGMCLELQHHTCVAPEEPNVHFDSGISVQAFSIPHGLPYQLRQLMFPLMLSAPLSAAERGRLTRQITSSSVPPGHEIHYSGYRRARWSPDGAAGPHRCVLTMLTRDHQIILACGWRKRFRPVLNLTPLWASWLQAHQWPLADSTKVPRHLHFDTDEAAESSENTSTFKSLNVQIMVSEIMEHTNRLSQLAIRDVCWSPQVRENTMTGEWLSEIMMITMTGHAVVWTVTAQRQQLHKNTSTAAASRPGAQDDEDRKTSLTPQDVKITSPDPRQQGRSPSRTQQQRTPRSEQRAGRTRNKRKTRSSSPANSETDDSKPEQPTPLPDTDGSNDLGANVSSWFDLEAPDCNCINWTVTPQGLELVFVGVALGCVRVFSVKRSPDNSIQDIVFIGQVFNTDKVHVRSIDVVEYCDWEQQQDAGSNDAANSAGQPPALTTESCNVLLAVSRNMQLCVALLRITGSTCNVLATAEASVARFDLSSIVCVDREHIYCTSQDGFMLCVSVLLQTPPAYPPEQQNPNVFTTTHTEPYTPVDAALRKTTETKTTKDSPTKKAATTATGRESGREDKSVNKSPVSEIDVSSREDSAAETTNTKDSTNNSSAKDTASDTKNNTKDSPVGADRNKTLTVQVGQFRRGDGFVSHVEKIEVSHPTLGVTNRIRVVCTTYNNCGVGLSLRRLVLSELSLEGAAFLSMVASPNKVFFATVESLRVSFDALVLRECTQLSVFLVNKSATLQHHLVQHLQQQTTHLHNLRDVLTAVRLLAVRGDHLDVTPFVEQIALATAHKTGSQVSAGTLKLLLWMCKMYATLSTNCCDVPRLPQPDTTWKSLEEELDSQVLRLWLQSVVKRYHDDQRWCNDDLNTLLNTSLSLMCDYLIMHGPSQHSQMAMAVLLRLKGGSRRQCGLGGCQLSVNLSSLTEARCTDGHVSKRCCRSLLPVPPLYLCVQCSTLLHCSAATELCGGLATCTICEGVVESVVVTRAEVSVLEAGRAMLPRVTKPVLSIKSRKTKSSNCAKRI